MKLSKKSVVILCLVLILTASIVMNVISLIKINSMKLLNYGDIDLSKFMYADITKMYAQAGWNPYLEGEFYDEEFLAEVREMFSLATFQKTEKPRDPVLKNLIFGKPTGDASPYVVFYTEDSRVCFSPYKGLIRISFDGGKPQYYRSNITREFYVMLNRFIEEEFPNDESIYE